MSDLLRLQGSIEIEAAAGDKKPRRLSILAYNGDQMTIDGFGPVVIALNGLDLPSAVPILADHNNTLASIIASGKPSIANGALTLTATLADSPAAVNVASLLASGVSLQASVGAEPTQRIFIKAGERVRVNGKDITAGAKGLLVVEKAALREVSIVPVGADGNTSVSLAASQRKGNLMPDTLPIDRDAILREERERRTTIDRICADLQLDVAAAAQLETIRAKCISGEIGVDVLRAGALDLLRASRASAPAVSASGNYITSADHLTAALMVRAGYGKAAEEAYGPNIMQQSQRLHDASLLDLCRAALMIDGRPSPHGRDAMIRAGLSTGSMPIALGNTANKIAATAYRMAPAAWRSFAAPKSCKDFKDHTSIRPTFAGDLLELGSGGEVKHGSFAEETFTYNIGTYAKQLQIDRKAIINDDASVFSEVVPGLSRAAMRTLNGLVATTILANAGSFWSTGNANYFEGAATNLQASSLATAIRYLRQMKDGDENLLDLQPAVLLVPPELEHTAKALVTSSTLQRYVASGTDQAPMGNPLENVAQVVVEPRLSDSGYSGHSATGWYLFSDPMNAGMVVGFLDGLDTPTLETFGLDADINHLSFGFRCFHDFGAALGDYRASIRSKGAA